MIFIVAVLALLVRLPGIVQGSFAFTYDIGRDLLAVRDILGGNFTLLGPTTGQLGLYYGPWWYWILLPPFLLASGSPAGVALFVALSGVLAAIGAYAWGKRFVDGRFAALFGLILATSPEIVASTTQIWSPDLLIVTTLFLILFLFHVPKLGTRMFLVIGFLLGLQGELEAVYGVLFLLAWLTALLVWYRGFMSIWKVGAILVGIFSVELPRIIFELRHSFIQTKSILGGLGSEINPGIRTDYLVFSRGNLGHVVPGDVVQLLLVGCFLGILIVSWKRYPLQLTTFVRALGTMVAVFWIATIFFPRGFWPYYLIGLPVVYAFLVALSLSTALKAWSRGALVLTALYFFFLVKPLEFIDGIRKPPFIGNAAVFRNQREVIDYIYQEAGGPFKYIAYTPPQIDYTWQYLFSWYGKKKYGYVPDDSNWNSMFVILEPDPDYIPRILDWLKVRKNDGILIQTKTFESGIRVQTRKPNQKQ